MKKQAVCKGPTPVLNTPYFNMIFGGKSGKDLLRDQKGHVRALEFVALENTRFDIEDSIPRHDHYIFKVRDKTYPAENLYVDSRFVRLVSQGDSKLLQKPDPHSVLAKLQSMIGKPYIWGGNWSKGVKELLLFYPPKKTINSQLKTLWTFEGVDCSGLLYEATEGYTPRNTSELLHFGNPVVANPSSLNEILRVIKPLDLIIYPGHMFIIFDEEHTIESRENSGVVRIPIRERLEELLSLRRYSEIPLEAQDQQSYFVIRRVFSI